MTSLKTYGTIAIMIGCFAIVYPRFMHPILSNIFGSGDSARKSHDSTIYPPGHKGQQERGGGAHPDDVRRHMRHGPHPGMRAAAEMQRQQSQQGSGRGMMGVVLPMYAVGIVLYLGYTLYKVFNRTNSKNSDSSRRYSWDKSGRYVKDRDRMGFPKDFSGPNSEIRNFLHDQEHRQNLEDLLTRVDDKNVSVEEMKVLQKRLEETEAQMTRILQAMRGINENVDNLATGQTGPQSNDTNNDENTGDVVQENDPTGEGKSAAETTQPAKEQEAEGKGNNPGSQNEASVTDADNHDNDDKDEEGRENDGDENNDSDDGSNQEEEVDEMIDENKDENVNGDGDDDERATAVRQRNVKTNEQ